MINLKVVNAENCQKKSFRTIANLSKIIFILELIDAAAEKGLGEIEITEKMFKLTNPEITFFKEKKGFAVSIYSENKSIKIKWIL